MFCVHIVYVRQHIIYVSHSCEEVVPNLVITLLYIYICMCHIVVYIHMYVSHCCIYTYVCVTLLYIYICMCHIVVYIHMYVSHCCIYTYVCVTLLYIYICMCIYNCSSYLAVLKFIIFIM